MDHLNSLRQSIRTAIPGDEAAVIRQMLTNAHISAAQRQTVSTQAADWVNALREQGNAGLMESFLAEYGLSTEEGVALMCMAEAYLRVPDNDTLDELIEDKIGPQNFAEHLGHSSSLMVNASTWGLMLTGSVLSRQQQQGLLPALRGLVRRVGEPVIRTAVKQMMKMMGSQFVLGETIEDAIANGKHWQNKGYRYSFDMLGEAALTQADADRYYLAYADAITELSRHCQAKNVRLNPGISVKLSALFPRYETLQQEQVMAGLFPAIRSLCLLAKKAGMGLNIDAEEVERLDLSLEMIGALIAEPSLKGWDGLGVVVQAYGYRAPHVIDWLYEQAKLHDRKLMVRLVKGAYWDREIKRSQELGLAGYPVYTHKNNTDVAYLYCAEKLLAQRDRIFPQFATHNAHTMAAIVELAGEETDTGQTNVFSYEFQRLHGMGEALHELVRKQQGLPCRIYAPVGVHQDLLAYLVRRLLENGANASFVSQLLNDEMPATAITRDPYAVAEQWLENPVSGVKQPQDLYQPERINSRGFDWQEPDQIEQIMAAREPWHYHQWQAAPLLAHAAEPAPASKNTVAITNPATDEPVGSVQETTLSQLQQAVSAAQEAQADWAALTAAQRAQILNKAADRYEAHYGELFALLTREAGKTLQDAIAELREAVDFLRYYAAQAQHLTPAQQALGVVACISPWNFPLAIFTGQLSAALAVGNAVLVKPAEATPLIAWRAVQLLHEAGVPVAVCQYLPGAGGVIGAALSSDPEIDGLIFTGSNATAKHIERNMSQHLAASAPLIAETGGLNAMIVDSTALPEQAVTDIINAAFQSAGQRCSALRMLYVQEDIAATTLEMLYGAMDLLQLGDPWQLATDIGPVIDDRAAQGIQDYLHQHQQQISKQLAAPQYGHFIAPTVLRVSGIADLTHEVFGPVLHVATFKATELEQIVADINASGYGLTFGLHTRIDSRVQTIVDQLRVGNAYVNRNQIGAIVGSQPFGGEGLSGTGPKAGGPYYLQRLVTQASTIAAIPTLADISAPADPKTMTEQQRFDPQPYLVPALSTDYAKLWAYCAACLPEQQSLPGPTGEDNLLSLHPRGLTIIATPAPEIAFQQALQALYCANPVQIYQPGFTEEQQSWLSAHRQVSLIREPLTLAHLQQITELSSLVCHPSSGEQALQASEYRQALAEREGPIVWFITDVIAPYLYMQERHLCINTTASGGNVELLATVS